MPNFDEPFFEPLARLARFVRGSIEIDHTHPVTIADIGCGPKIRFFHFARRTGIHISSYYAFDPLLSGEVLTAFQNNRSMKLDARPAKNKICLADHSVDYAVAFAFLEHVDNPAAIFAEMIRIVKPGGKVIVTTPSNIARPLLEFMSYRLHLISRREIDEHKNYFSKSTLLSLVPHKLQRKLTIKHRYFELFLNNLLVITKNETV